MRYLEKEPFGVGWSEAYGRNFDSIRWGSTPKVPPPPEDEKEESEAPPEEEKEKDEEP